jgi:hypothetical protein
LIELALIEIGLLSIQNVGNRLRVRHKALNQLFVMFDAYFVDDCEQFNDLLRKIYIVFHENMVTISLLGTAFD